MFSVLETRNFETPCHGLDLNVSNIITKIKFSIIHLPQQTILPKLCVSSQSRCLKKDKNFPCDFKYGNAAQ